MKVLVVVHGFPPAAQGGSEIYAHAHARALHRAGDEVVVLTREQDPTRAEYAMRTERRDGLSIVWINNTFRSTRTFEETYRNEAIGAIADGVIDDFGPDVAHIHHLTCLSTTIVRSLAERHIACFVTLHDYWLMCHRGQLLDVDYHLCDGPQPGAGCGRCLGPAGGAGNVAFLGAATLRAVEARLPVEPARQLRRVAERLASVVIDAGKGEDQARRRDTHMRQVCADVTQFFAPSQYVRDRFVQWGVSPDRIAIARLGLDSATRRGAITRTAPDRLRLGFLGSLMISKGPHVLLEAVRYLPRGAASVDVFGAHAAYHGDDRYRDQIAPLLRLDDVRAHGSIPHDRVSRALASMDVLVVPSIWPETCSLVIQEAFLAGVPVVASRIGAIPEVVDDGRNGLLFTAGDTEDLARVLNRLRTEPELLDTLRAGIPPVRSIDDDVRCARETYRGDGDRRLGDGDPAGRWMGSPSPRTAPRTAAVVLNYRTPDETFLAVRSVLASRQPFDDVIVVNNDRGDGNLNVGGPFQGRPGGAESPALQIVGTGRNLGFSGGMNVGIRDALSRGADRILLVNSDVIVPPDCLERLGRCLDAAPGTGIAGPVVLARSEPDLIASLGMSYASPSGRMRHRGFGTRVAFGQVVAGGAVDGVSGCLMLVKREVFEAVGLLDEDYFFSFEDLDFCLRARRAGFATVLATDAVVYHEGGRSMGADSPRRLYFAARNHLLLARRAAPQSGRFASLGRAVSIVMLNLAHAALSRGGPLLARLSAVARGTRDYVAGRFGPDV